MRMMRARRPQLHRLRRRLRPLRCGVSRRLRLRARGRWGERPRRRILQPASSPGSDEATTPLLMWASPIPRMSTPQRCGGMQRPTAVKRCRRLQYRPAAVAAPRGSPTRTPSCMVQRRRARCHQSLLVPVGSAAAMPLSIASCLRCHPLGLRRHRASRPTALTTTAQPPGCCGSAATTTRRCNCKRWPRKRLTDPMQRTADTPPAPVALQSSPGVVVVGVTTMHLGLAWRDRVCGGAGAGG